jgi:hypothetical protein
LKKRDCYHGQRVGNEDKNKSKKILSYKTNNHRLPYIPVDFSCDNNEIPPLYLMILTIFFCHRSMFFVVFFCRRCWLLKKKRDTPVNLTPDVIFYVESESAVRIRVRRWEDGLFHHQTLVRFGPHARS